MLARTRADESRLGRVEAGLVRRAKSYWAPVLIAAVSLASLSSAALVRSAIPQGQGRWLLSSFVYVTHIEHFANDQRWRVGASVIGLLIAIAALAMVRGPDLASRLATVGLALGVAGTLSNVAELLARGSVTDWLGINAPNGGAYSGGDACVGLALSMIPAASLAAFAQAVGKAAGVVAWLCSSAILLLLGFLFPHAAGLALAAAATAIVTLIAIGIRHQMQRMAGNV